MKEGKYAPNTFLFDPYFKKYESWRDNGLDEVKSILNKKQNTIMISLDLKEYYYSSRINFNQLKKDMKKARERLIQKKLGKNSSVDNNDEEINDFLNDFIEKVFENYHKKFSFKSSANEKDSDNSYMIPLGFLPSLIIANWNLQGFDQAILENVHPNYYGRYVDDILIVLPSHEKSDSHGKQHIEKLTLETVIKKYLTPCEEDPINNILQIKNNSKKNTYFIQNLPIFSLENENYNYEYLEIQQEKFKVYFFNHENSQAIIDKFRKAIAVNSSEFRLLHGVELTAKNLKYDLYQMSYEDSINKLRGIHDFKLNKYEASKILSRLIDASKCFNTLDKKLQKEITSELMSAFSADALSFINLWEKIFSYLYINEEYTTLKKFIKQIIWLINNIDINDKSDSNKMHCKLKEDIESSLNESLKLFLYSSIVRVLSLKCNEQSKEIYKMLDKFLGYKKDSKDCAGNFLVASLQNNRLMKFPLQNTNKLGAKSDYDLIKPEYKDLGFFNGFSYPRYVKCYEVMLNEINKNIFTTKEKQEEDTENTYLDNFENIWDKYKKINFNFPRCATDKANDEDKNNSFIKKIEFPHINKEKYILREVCVDNECKDDIKIGLINTKLNKEYCENRIKNKPNLHYKRFDKIINIINESIKKKVEFLLMPELYIPYEWIDKIIEVSRNHQMVMVFGVEYIVHNDIVKNCLMVSLPSKNKGYNSNILTYRLKNYYAPDEIRTISKLNKKDAKVKLPTYILYNWNGISFAPYCCYEISDIVSRGLFKGKCDIVTVSEFNKDIKYFNNICESLSRDLFCYCISSNTSEYGGTSIIQPSSSEDKYIIQLKGGEEDYVVTYKLDISDLKDKKLRSYTADFSDTQFKPQPPGLNYFNKNLSDGLDE